MRPAPSLAGTRPVLRKKVARTPWAARVGASWYWEASPSSNVKDTTTGPSTASAGAGLMVAPNASAAASATAVRPPRRVCPTWFPMSPPGCLSPQRILRALVIVLLPKVALSFTTTDLAVRRAVAATRTVNRRRVSVRTRTDVTRTPGPLTATPVDVRNPAPFTVIVLVRPRTALPRIELIFGPATTSRHDLQVARSPSGSTTVTVRLLISASGATLTFRLIVLAEVLTTREVTPGPEMETLEPPWNLPLRVTVALPAPWPSTVRDRCVRPGPSDAPTVNVTGRLVPVTPFEAWLAWAV